MRFEIEGLQFEWDDNKAAQNLSKHGLKFSEGAEAFLDEQALFEPDEGATGEARYHAIGSLLTRLLIVFVAYTERNYHGQEFIRLISARKADKNERQRYFEARSE
jgi:uncharacterized protein